MIGTRLAHYDITGYLGSGGMDVVYQATDSKLGRSVAIKLLPEEFQRDSERAARSWLWNRDGKEFFYRDNNQGLMAVDIKADTTVSHGTPPRLFTARWLFANVGPSRNQFDVAPDGQRFLGTVQPPDSPPSPIKLILNWTALLKK